MNTYIKMCEEAKKIQEALKDKFDYRSQGWCTYHKCRIEEDQMGVPICPGFMEKYHSAITREHPVLVDREEGKFGFGSPEDCEYHKKWIGLATLEQLLGMFIKNKLRNKYGYEMAWFGKFYEWATEYSEHYSDVVYTNYALTFKTLKQLLLAFVMYEKFQKVWNSKSEKWEKKGD